MHLAVVGSDLSRSGWSESSWQNVTSVSVCETPDTVLTEGICKVLWQTGPWGNHFWIFFRRKCPVLFKVDETNLCQLTDAASRNFQLLDKWRWWAYGVSTLIEGLSNDSEVWPLLHLTLCWAWTGLWLTSFAEAKLPQCLNMPLMFTWSCLPRVIIQDG